MSEIRKRNRVSAAIIGVAGVMLFPIVSQAAAPRDQMAQSEPGKFLKKDQDAANSQLLAAAEPFEALTEQSFSAKSAQLDSMIAKAEGSASRVNGLLSADEQVVMKQRLKEIKEARTKNERSELALASVEGYRILVSATHTTKVPNAVNLLDYAGFRYDADVKTKPIRWEDMKNANTFATQQWNSIAGAVKDNTLRKKVSDVLQEMESAVSSKSSDRASRAVTTELDLVDKLEAYFNRA